MTSTTGPAPGTLDSGLVGTIPFGIASVNVEKAWELIEGLTSRNASLADARHDQSVLCALVNASFVSTANSAAARLLETGERGLSSFPVAMVLPEESRRLFVEGLLRISEGRPPLTSQAKIQYQNGNEEHVILSIWSPDGSKAPMHIGLGLTAISDQVAQSEETDQLRSELAHAARISMLGELTASISHEVNQPLSSIVTSAEAGLRWLDRDVPDIEEVRAILTSIARNGNRASEIISSMRAMARNTKSQRTYVDLNALVEEVILILNSELSKRQITLRRELAPAAPNVFADRTQIMQVIANLALNAAQAMADGQSWNRTLMIRTRQDKEGTAVVEVEDSGPGVDPRVRQRLFESFYTTKQGGLGVGLAICRSIIEAHGSSIELQSSPHQGARFSFKLSMTASQAESLPGSR